MQVVELVGKPAEAWEGSEFGTTTDIVFLYRGEKSYHAVWFMSLVGTTAFERSEEWKPDRNKVRDGLKQMGFRQCKVYVEDGSLTLK